MIEIVNDNYNDYILNSNKLIILDFESTNCVPCKMLNKILEEIEIENKNITILKVNIEDNPNLTIKFGIMSVPSLCFIKNNVVIKKINGLKDKEYIEKLIEKGI